MSASAPPRLPAPISVCVYCGARPGRDPVFAEAAAAFGRGLALRGMRLVYGGGGVGLMGVAANAALQAGGAVTGIIPRHLLEAEAGHGALSELEVVETMHARKARMAALSDAFVALPGGIGTLDETIEILTWKQLGLHAKPVFIVDVAGAWTEFLRMVDAMIARGFSGRSLRELFQRFDGVEDALAALERLVPERGPEHLERA